MTDEQIITRELTKAAQEHGASDIDAFVEQVKDLCFVATENDEPRVCVKIGDRPIPQLSERTPATDHETLMGVEELVEELKDAGHFDDYFTQAKADVKADEPETDANGKRLIRCRDGRVYTQAEFFKLSSAEQISIGREVAPPSMRKKPQKKAIKIDAEAFSKMNPIQQMTAARRLNSK